jgi:hypothetical protein
MWSRLWPAGLYYVLVMPAVAVRSFADDYGLPVRREFNRLEAALLNDAPTHWLQGSLIDADFTRMAGAAIYFTWFFVPITTAIAVLLFRPSDYWRFVGFLLLVYYAILPFYMLYPLEAPWAHDPGVTRYIGEIFPEATSKDPNQYAAMPSLHVALPAAAALWYGLRTFWGGAVLSYSLLIAFVVIFGGEHYVADVVGGYVLAFFIYTGARRLGLPLFARDESAGEVRRLQVLPRRNPHEQDPDGLAA